MDSKKLYSALYALTANKVQATLHPSLRGVYFDNGSIVASNAFAIAVAKSEYPPEWEGKILDKAGEGVKEKPLNFKGVLPYDPERTLRTSDYTQILDVDQFKEALRMMPKSKDTDEERIGIEIGGAVFYPPLVLKCLSVFEALDQTPEIFIYTAGVGVHKKCCMLSKEGSLALVCPLLFASDPARVIAFEEALMCGDLL